MTHHRKRAAPAKDPTRLPTASNGDSIAETERPMYWPLAWDRDEKPASFRGKAKRNARRAAADRKRQSGQIDPALIAILALAFLECLLIWGAS